MYACIYADAVEKLGKGRYSFQRRILGLLMAHEIGHLLLATESHSTDGIMQSLWSATDLADATQGRLGFSSSQTRRIRAQMAVRIGAQ